MGYNGFGTIVDIPQKKKETLGPVQFEKGEIRHDCVDYVWSSK